MSQTVTQCLTAAEDSATVINDVNTNGKRSTYIGGTADTDTETPFAWEAYQSYKVNDSVTVSPAIFGATDRTGTSGVDITGAVVQTTFKF